MPRPAPDPDPLYPTGPQLGPLRDALVTAFPERRFEQLLVLRLDVSVEELAPGSLGLPDLVYEVLKAARTEGWLRSLVRSAVAEAPHVHELAACAAGLGVLVQQPAGLHRAPVPPVPPGAPRGLPVPRVASFDLTEFARRIKSAQRAAPSRLLGFGVPYSDDDMFERALRDRIGELLGRMEQKPPVTLDPAIAGTARALADLRRYQGLLARGPVLCLVRAGRADPASIAGFWSDLREAFQDPDNWLVLVITAAADAGFPDGVTVLPAPAFDLDDVAVWAVDVFRLAGWPVELADTWAEELWSRSLDAGGDVVVRWLLEALHEGIDELRENPYDLRRRLEEGKARVV